MSESIQPTVQRSESRSNLDTMRRSKLFFFAGAFISFVLSIFLWFSGSKEQGLFVGLWVPSILAAGCLLLVGEAREDV